MLLRWATTSDEGHTPDGKLGAALSDLRSELEAAGLIDPRVEPAKCEDHWFQDLNTGEWLRTKRSK